MNWTDATATYSENGQTLNVAGPAFTMEFFGEGAKLAPFGEKIFTEFLNLLPTDRPLYQLGNNATEYTPMDTKGARRIQKTMTELAKRGRFYTIKDAPSFDVGQYSLELNLGNTGPFCEDVVYVALPYAEVNEKLDSIVAAFRKLVTEFPFRAAVAGYGFDLVWGREFEMAGMPTIMQTGLRYHGLLVRNRLEDSFRSKTLKSAGWLTFLDKDQLHLAGGGDAVRQALDPSVQVTDGREGLLMQAGERPPVGDVNRQDKDVIPLASVNRAISKLRIEAWKSPALFKVAPSIADGWLKRFDS